ncbi:hypothetical protein FQR65_LT06213 [Abscondita terminalis]|nr:hypothetical protein FQR65_LT06213 [Abscondita terminalis]
MSDTTETSPKVRDPHRNKIKRKFNKTRLPTPPPDPTIYPEILDQPESPASPDKDAHFFEYIHSFPKIPHVPLSPSGVTEDAFDHLERLYRLMEQMLNLRQQNAKLQRRIHDLEHLKNLQTANRHVENVPAPVFEDISEFDDDSAFAENLLDTMLVGTKKDFKTKPWNRSRLRQSLIKKQRNRSTSLNDKSFDFSDDRRLSSACDRDKPAKVSKWTKVKAAFKWEKASPSVSGAKSQDSGIGGMLPVNYEIARYLRVPSTTEDPGISPADSGAADGSTPGTLSSASSTDDLHRQDTRTELQVSDDDHHSINLEDGNLSRQGSNSNNSSRASWFKTKNSRSSPIHFQDKFRLSIRSDDSKNDISDNEDLLDHNENVDVTNYSKKPEPIPVAIVERYKQVIDEDETINKQSIQAKVSKWNRVKKAFLTPSSHHISYIHKNNSSVLSTYKDNRLLKHNDETKKIQDEIQKNYRQLQKKLSIEFQGKLQEWDKLKSQGTISVNKNDSGDDQKDNAFMKKMEEWQRIKSQPSKPGQSLQLLREENLAPEFKKKLEEWQKIKKCAVKDDCNSVTKSKKKIGEWPKWKSISGHRDDHPLMESQPLSDDFLRKLEEWRKIKELHKHNGVKQKTPSPKLRRKQNTDLTCNTQKPVKDQDEKELHWFEKELNKIELEKQRLEEERDKFLQREEKLAKLRRTVMGEGNKKDVLIHTSSGFYRFEGISRKFTQKLCEWEKAQGIGPEASTFALLSPTLKPHITVDLYETIPTSTQTVQCLNTRIVRSKSAESVSTKNLIQSSPSHHPSSLSLNDVDELEKQMSLSRTSSMQDIDVSLEKFPQDEPEAVIVEVEDEEEETAGLLEERLEEKHFPVYQREMALSICEKQPCIVPYIQSLLPDNFQSLVLLIDKTLKLIKIVEDDQEPQWINSEIEVEGHQADSEQSPSPDVLKRKDKYKLQNQRGEAVLEMLIRIQEIHSKYVCEISMEEDINESQTSMIESIQELFSDLFQMIEQLQSTLCGRLEESCNKIYFQFNDFSYSNITAITSEVTSKLCELKRILSRFYSTADKTTGIQQLKPYHIECPKECTYELENNSVNTKRMRYKRKEYCNQPVCESEDSDACDTKDKCLHNIIQEELDPIIIEKLIIPTKPNYVNVQTNAVGLEQPSGEILVRTTRKLFAPFIRTDTSNLIESDMTENFEPDLFDNDVSVENSVISHRPPSKASPAPQRKASKEISPGIRLMLAKYNQLISKQDSAGVNKSGGSSGSASPVAWRSPVSERRVKAQRERYLEEIKKIDNYEVKKSASVNFLHLEQKSESSSLLATNNNLLTNKGILRSTSASVIQTHNTNKQDIAKHPPLKLVIPEYCNNNNNNQSAEARTSKINKAKEDFLNSPTTPCQGSSSAPPVFPTTCDVVMKYPTRTRYSQISMGSESSCDSSACMGILVKSASAGMINIDEDTYKQIDPAFHQEGYVSLPRSVTKQKEGLLGGKLTLSNIAAKFRKVKMRKNQKKMNTVSALCRQSLVVNISPDNQDNTEKQSRSDSLTVPVDKGASSSDDTSPSSSRSGSWIRRSKIFKVL